MTNFFSMAVRRMLVWETTDPLPSTVGTQDVIVLLPWDTVNLGAARTLAPGVTVLAYQNASSCSSAVATDGLYSTPVTAAFAAQNTWLLKNTSGQPFTFNNFNWLWAADIGNADYQRDWADGVITMLAAQGFDGVFADDVNPTIKDHYAVADVAKYPSDATYGAAMTSFVETAFPLIRTAGKQVVANIASEWIPTYNAVATPWLAYCDGALNEYYWQIPPP